jgi:hypothetical protein
LIVSINNNFNSDLIPSYNELVASIKLLDEPKWEELSAHPDHKNLFDPFGICPTSIGQGSMPVQNNQPRITSLEPEEQNLATVVFEETIHPKPQQRKRPAGPPVSAQTNKKRKVRDPRLQLLKESRTRLGITRSDLCKRVNDHLKKLGSELTLALTTLKHIENDANITSKTINAYYDAIKTVLAEVPEPLPAKIDPRPAYLQTLRINAGLSTTDELSKKLRVFAGIKISKSYLDKMEGGRLHKDVIDNLYPNIKDFLDEFMSGQNDI